MKKLIIILALLFMTMHPIDTKQCKWIRRDGVRVRICRMVELPLFYSYPGGK